MANQYLHSLSDTWNSALTKFFGIRMSVTDTTSDADSRVLEMIVDTVPVFSVRKDGAVLAEEGTAAAPTYTFEGDPNTGMYRVDADSVGLSAGGTERLRATTTGVVVTGTLTGMTDIAVADGGTGASTAAGARTNLGLGTMATQAASAVAVTGGTIAGITDLAVADGGTGASTAADARTNLGLGTIATQNANAVAITGGAVTGITDLAVADGGTGASNAANARTNLGAAAAATTITAGDGLTGGGNLSADRFFSVVAGDGIAVGPASVAVDSTVVRTTGTQDIGGVKGFNNQVFLNDVAVFATTIQQGDADGVTLGKRGLISTIGADNSLLTLQCLAATGNDELMFRVVRGTTARMRILADGDVENTNNSYGGISDKRLKTDIEPAKDQLEDIRKIDVVNYRLIETGERQVGVIAQDLQKIKPGLVVDGADGFLSVKYSVLNVLLLKAMQELADKVDALEARTAELEGA